MTDRERGGPSPHPTGDSRVDQVIADLAAVDEMPLDDRPAALEAAHDRLREILGELGDAGRPDGTGRPGEPGRPGWQGQLGTR